jgi:class 3 adenylate cyclase/predicted ATPase
VECRECGSALGPQDEACQRCGAPAGRPCPLCGALAGLLARYCATCGTKLEAAARESAAGLPEPELRSTTVLLCGLADSAALTVALDPEDASELLARFQRTIRDVIQRHKSADDCRFDRGEGDSQLFCFGLLQAHEDDAECAVRAALDVVSEVEKLRVVPGVVLRARVGIATGLVVVEDSRGEGDSRRPMITGSAPNLAARLQAVAAPGTVVISSTTRKVVGDLFDCADLGALRLKGFRDPVNAWQAIRARKVDSRFEALHPAALLSPLVGREREIALLLERWQLARKGRGQTAVVSGEPGIGKSRLLSALHERVKAEAAVTLRLQCSAYYANSAFYPISEYLQRALDFQQDEPPPSKLDRIERVMRERYGRPVRDVQLIAPILGVRADDRYRPLGMTPRRQKDDTIRALLDLVEAMARQQMSLILFEDVHWADPSTVEVLVQLTRRVARFPLLLVLTHRPEFDAGQLADQDVTRLALSRLNPAQTSTLVTQVSAGRSLPADLVRRIVAQSDGVPLFIEELTKAILEAPELAQSDGSRSVAPGSIPVPATLRDSLMARLDRLRTGKLIAQIGALIGREFSYELLSAVAPVTKAEMDRALDSLQRSGLTFARGRAAGAVYAFKHALVQDIARDSLLKSARQELHGKIACALEDRFSESARAHPELLAHHYTEAAQFEAAVEYWKQAGDSAAQRSANVEAINHLEKGLRLLESCPYGPERERQALELYATLGRVLIAVKGYASPEVEHAFARTHELFARVADSSQKFVVLRGECQLLVVQAKYEAAHARANELGALADAERNSGYRLDAHLMTGLVCLYQGRFREARQHLQACVSMYDAQEHLPHAVRQGVDIGSASLAYYARTLWFLGHPDLALKRSTEAVEMARTPTIPLGIAQASGMLALVHHVRGDLVATKEWVDRTVRYAQDQGHVYWVALGGILDSWLRAHEGKSSEAAQEISRSIARYQDTGARLGLSWFLLLLAEAHQNLGQIGEALEALDNALRHIDETGEMYYAAEAHRKKGELLLAHSGAQARAEACFLQSLEIAREQHAKAWELRAAISLARLWSAQGKGAAPLRLLAAAHADFGEGHATADLREAKVLLEALGAPTSPAGGGAVSAAAYEPK